MSKHTPGPWEWDDEVPTCYSETDWSEVAPWLVDSNGNDVLSGQIVCKNKADLALIAAAPETAAERDRLKEINAELLEALESIADYWNQDQNNEAMTDACWHAIDAARAAIAKATEGQQ